MYGSDMYSGFITRMWGGFSESKAKRIREYAKHQNEVEFQEQVIYMTQLVLSLFKWEGLPEQCNERALERVLFNEGRCLIFHSPKVGWLNTSVELTGQQNFYYDSIKRIAVAYRFREVHDETNSVLIRNNDFMHPSRYYVEMMARKIADANRSLDVYAENLKRPFVLFGTKDVEPTIKNIREEKSNNEYLIILNEQTLSPENLQQVNLSVPPEGITKLIEYRHHLDNDFQTRFGFDNVQTKKERMNLPETESNTQLLKANIGIMLEQREKACEEFNEMYAGQTIDGETVQEISVSLKYEIKEAIESMENVPRGTSLEKRNDNG